MSAAQTTALLAQDETSAFRDRWQDVQSTFVDEPQASVERADALVADLMTRIGQVFADTRRDLEAQWEGGDEADTESLRLALQRYRTFFERLLAT